MNSPRAYFVRRRIICACLIFWIMGCGPVGQADAPQRQPAPVALPSDTPIPGPKTERLQDIWGQWRFVRMRYQNQDMPPRDPRLELIFEFSETNESRLFWTFDGGRNFCERKAHYQFEENWLVEKITWVNPANMNSCASDPDMQLGREAKTQAFLRDSELWVNIGLGAEDLYYVWQKIDVLERPSASP